MTIRKRYIGRLAAVLVGLTALSVATSPLADASQNAKVPPHPDTVTLADFTPSSAFAAQYAAFGKTGAMKAVEKKFKTTVKVTTFTSNADSMSAMLGGNADFTCNSLTAFGTVAAAGKAVTVAFAPFIGGGGVLIGAKKYEKSRGSDLAKYAGSTFGFTRVGSASQVLLKLSAERAGLDFSKEKQIAFGTPPAGIGVLQSGRADLVAVDPTTAGAAIDAGTAYLILNWNDPKTAYPVVGEQITNAYGFNTAFVKKYPALSKALIQALVTGLDAVKKVANKPAKVLKLFPADIQAQVKNGWTTAWKLSVPGIVANDGTISGRGLNDTLTFNQTAGLLTPAALAAVPKLIDNSLVTGHKTPPAS